MKSHKYIWLLACGMQFMIYGMKAPDGAHPLQIQLSDGKESEIIDTPFWVTSEFTNEPLLCDIDSIPLSQQKKIVENLYDAVYPVKPCAICLKDKITFRTVYLEADSSSARKGSRADHFFVPFYTQHWNRLPRSYCIFINAKNSPACEDGQDSLLVKVLTRYSLNNVDVVRLCLENIIVYKDGLSDEFEKQYRITALKDFKQECLQEPYFNKISHLLLCSDVFLQRHRDHVEQCLNTQLRKMLPIIVQQKALTEKGLGKEYWKVINLNERLRRIGNSRVIVDDESDTDEAEVTVCQLLSYLVRHWNDDDEDGITWREGCQLLGYWVRNWCKNSLNFKRT